MSIKSKISRRELLRSAAMLSGGALLAACAPRAAAPVAPAAPAAAPKAEEAKPTEAPATAKGGKVQVLHRQEYFKELETALKTQTEEFIKSIGYEPDVSTVNPEVFGDFMAKMPGGEKQRNWPSTVAYVAQLMIHRYAMLGVLDERGYPIDEMGVLEVPEAAREREGRNLQILPGKRCLECGNSAVIRKDGCEFCTACGAVGACG